MADTILMVGTRKGLWIGRSDERRADWTWSGPHFDMTEVPPVVSVTSPVVPPVEEVSPPASVAALVLSVPTSDLGASLQPQPTSSIRHAAPAPGRRPLTRSRFATGNLLTVPTLHTWSVARVAATAKAQARAQPG